MGITLFLVGASLVMNLIAAGVALRVGLTRVRPPWIALGVAAGAFVFMRVDALTGVLAGARSDLSSDLGMFALSVLALSVTFGFLLEQARLERELESERRRAEPITERVRELEKDAIGLQSTSQRYRLAALGARDGLWSLDVESGQIHLTARYCELFGFGNEDVTLPLATWFESIHPDDVDAVRAAFETYVNGDWGTFDCEHRFVTDDGSELWVKTRGAARRSEDGRAREVAGSTSNITAEKLTELEGLAGVLRDPLTGLGTRAKLVAEIARSISLAELGTQSFALLTVDLDNFKKINSSFESHAADQLLVVTARRLASLVRPSDCVARIGAHRFGMLLTDTTDAERVTAIAHRVLGEMRAPLRVAESEHVSPTGNIGIALSTMNYREPDEVLRDAEAALKRAKEQGSGRYHLFDLTLREILRNQADIEIELLRGPAHDQFVLQYQPIVALSTGRIHGFEALVRWQHPKRGLLSPNEFIPLAEQTGGIVAIGQVVLEKACRQAKQWADRFGEGQLFVNVNVSGRQLEDPGLLDDVRAALSKTGANPRSVKLEITESILVSQHGAAGSALAGLQALGLELCIDDFGTGYSSLAYLASLPVDKLKIDRAFVTDIQDRPQTIEVVRSIRELGRRLGKRVVAEGVQTGGELAKLRELECDYAQGFFFSGPVDAEEATRLVEREIFAFDEPVGRVSGVRVASTPYLVVIER